MEPITTKNKGIVKKQYYISNILTTFSYQILRGKFLYIKLL